MERPRTPLHSDNSPERPVAKNPKVGIERAGLLAHSAIGALQLLLPLLRLLALRLADDERTGADVGGLVEIGLDFFGHDERNLREVDLNP